MTSFAVVDCGVIPAVENATVSVWLPVNSTLYQSVVSYTCLPLMWFRRGVFTEYVDCKASGQWSTITDVCHRKCYANFLLKE